MGNSGYIKKCEGVQVSAKDRVNVFVRGQSLELCGHIQDPSVIQYPLTSWSRSQGGGEGTLSPPRRSMSFSNGGLHPSLFSYFGLGEHFVCKSPTLGTLLSLLLLLLVLSHCCFQ